MPRVTRPPGPRQSPSRWPLYFLLPTCIILLSYSNYVMNFNASNAVGTSTTYVEAGGVVGGRDEREGVVGAPVSARTLYYPLNHVTYNLKSDTIILHSLDSESLTVMQNTGESVTRKPGSIPWTWNGQQRHHYPFTQISPISSTYDESKCSYVEERPTIMSRVKTGTNCFACNAGHLVINVINPLMVWFFYSRWGRIPGGGLKEDDVESVKEDMKEYLFLVGSDVRINNVAFGGGTGKGGGTPSFLFDFVLRSFNEWRDMGEYLSSKGDNICFRNIVIPSPHRAGTWDAMYGTLKGRFGTGGFYEGFWVGVREVVGRVYGFEFGGGEQGENKRWKEGDLGRKIKVVWPWRGGGRSRDDGNRDLLERVFGDRFNFHILDGPDFTWHGPNEAAREQVAKKTMGIIRDADVMIGLFGANLWNSLLMRSGSILIELKAPYGYCGNENGRTLSNHNHLSFYSGDSRSMAVAKVGTLYTEEFLKELADEIEDLYKFEVLNQPQEKPSGECLFKWPEEDWKKNNNGRILTRPEDRFCYLEKSQKGWYQLKDKGGWDNNCEKNQGKVNEAYLEEESMFCPEFCRE
ncbi:hypothetical protein TrLO_g3449 [Triparma laevis f. longispina]|uniref:Uncharacterized protein n=1 Tax=Triparma laevis f. longispina TaxID=1714387 RepID=A0A9W7DYU9_9STRA|nr:hypothetical protein TrLO_g3449 [Triparma laevis f. longispina]